MSDKKYYTSFLRIKFSNGDVYDVQTSSIAIHRARYYADNDVPRDGVEFKNEEEREEWKKVYNDEFKYAMNDSFELKDWAANNMDWADVEPFAVLIDRKIDFDHEAEWCNANMSIVKEESI